MNQDGQGPTRDQEVTAPPPPGNGHTVELTADQASGCAVFLTAAMDDPDRWKQAALSVCGFLFQLAMEARGSSAEDAPSAAQAWTQQIEPLQRPPQPRPGPLASALPEGAAGTPRVRASAEIVQKCAAIAEAVLDGRTSLVPVGHDVARYFDLLSTIAMGDDSGSRSLQEVQGRITALPWPPRVTRDV